MDTDRFLTWLIVVMIIGLFASMLADVLIRPPSFCDPNPSVESECV